MKHVFHCITLLRNTPLPPFGSGIYHLPKQTENLPLETRASNLRSSFPLKPNLVQLTAPLLSVRPDLVPSLWEYKFQISEENENKDPELEFRFKRDPKSKKTWFKEYQKKKKKIDTY